MSLVFKLLGFIWSYKSCPAVLTYVLKIICYYVNHVYYVKCTIEENKQQELESNKNSIIVPP